MKSHLRMKSHLIVLKQHIQQSMSIISYRLNNLRSANGMKIYLIKLLKRLITMSWCHNELRRTMTMVSILVQLHSYPQRLHDAAALTMPLSIQQNIFTILQSLQSLQICKFAKLQFAQLQFTVLIAITLSFVKSPLLGSLLYVPGNIF